MNLAGNLPSSVSEKTFHREVPYWRHFATNYPREVLGQASGHGVLLSFVHCRSWALEKLRVTQEPSTGEANSTAGGRKTCRHNTSKEDTWGMGWGAADLWLLLSQYEIRSGCCWLPCTAEAEPSRSCTCCSESGAEEDHPLHLRSLPNKYIRTRKQSLSFCSLSPVLHWHSFNAS